MGAFAPAVEQLPCSKREYTEIQRTVQAAQNGDRAAFEVVVKYFTSEVYQLSSRILDDPITAKDVTQDVFIRFYRHIHRFNPDRDLMPWLITITINVCKNYLKKRKKYATTTLMDPRIQAMIDPEDPGMILEDRNKQAWLSRALSTLSYRAKICLVLRDIHELRTEDVARILGISQKTVRSHISRARARIIELLGESDWKKS